MSDRHVSPPHTDSQRSQPALWPWGLALSLALMGSAWWAWDLFKSPEQDTAHPRLPTVGLKVPERDLLVSPLTATGASGPVTHRTQAP
jgi:hypothetical protein